MTPDIEIPADRVSHYPAHTRSYTIMILMVSFDTERSAAELEARLLKKSVSTGSSGLSSSSAWTRRS